MVNRNTERQRIVAAARKLSSMKIAAHIDRVKREYIAAGKVRIIDYTVAWRLR